MANCKDNCIHYKVCMYGDLTEYIDEETLKNDCDDYMSKDVVPKSEIMHVVGACYDKCEECRTKIANAVESMVVRDIFEEIEEVLNNIGYFDEIDFKALKKKYAERSENYSKS